MSQNITMQRANFVYGVCDKNIVLSRCLYTAQAYKLLSLLAPTISELRSKISKDLCIMFAENVRFCTAGRSILSVWIVKESKGIRVNYRRLKKESMRRLFLLLLNHIRCDV